ncbi:MAG: galactokinase [Ignavibacteriaceae bacterium]|nr:galactokinase [Ignavibacteriaceae bacterium]
MQLVSKVEEKFKELFNEVPVIIRSPGRVNLIGEHTDYNMGFVLPAAIDKAIYFAIAPVNDDNCTVYALDLNEECKFGINNLEKSEKGWPNYLMGVIEQLNNSGHSIKGFNCVFGGNIPIGAGLSSSAALEAGLAFALNYLFDLSIDNLTLVKIAQKAENEFVGVKCGIMDQYINIFGKSGNVLRIDCRSLEYSYFPFNYQDISIVLFDSRVSHSLASSEYNQRRIECGEGVNIIKKDFPNIQSLRDVSLDMLAEYKTKLENTIYRRCKYAVEENDRVLAACSALGKHDLAAFGLLMYKTHEGLSKDYEVSCKELDYLVELTNNNPDILGSRMMGGGFGGCTINLVKNDAIESVSKEIAAKYQKEFNIDANIYVTKISSGTSLINVKENAEA